MSGGQLADVDVAWNPLAQDGPLAAKAISTVFRDMLCGFSLALRDGAHGSADAFQSSQMLSLCRRSRRHCTTATLATVAWMLPAALCWARGCVITTPSMASISSDARTLEKLKLLYEKSAKSAYL